MAKGRQGRQNLKWKREAGGSCHGNWEKRWDDDNDHKRKERDKNAVQQGLSEGEHDAQDISHSWKGGNPH